MLRPLRRPLRLLIACPWMNREDLECSQCGYRDPPQLEGTDYMTHPLTMRIYYQRTKDWPHGKTWWSAFTDTEWQAQECCCMGVMACFEAAAPFSTTFTEEFIEEVKRNYYENELRTPSSSH